MTRYILLVPFILHFAFWLYAVEPEGHLALLMPDIGCFAIWFSKEITDGWDGSP